MTSLSRRGEVVNLRRGGRIEGELSIQEYIDVYCDEGMKKIVSQVPMDRIQDVALQTIVFTILMLSGSVAPSLENQVVIYYSIACMTPIVFDWCSSLLDTVRGQLTSCRIGRLNKFGFGSLICSYFFERTPSLSL